MKTVIATFVAILTVSTSSFAAGQGKGTLLRCTNGTNNVGEKFIQADTFSVQDLKSTRVEGYEAQTALVDSIPDYTTVVTENDAVKDSIYSFYKDMCSRLGAFTN